MKEIGYQREAVLEYAKRWAKGRNPRYLDFEHMGGDCTNFGLSTAVLYRQALYIR